MFFYSTINRMISCSPIIKIEQCNRWKITFRLTRLSVWTIFAAVMVDLSVIISSLNTPRFTKAIILQRRSNNHIYISDVVSFNVMQILLT